MKKADDLAAVALRRMQQHDLDFSADVRTGWSRFLLSLLHRSPEAMERAWKRVSDKYAETVDGIRDQYASIRGPTDPETVEEFRATVMPFAIRRFLVDHVMRIIDSEGIGPHLNGMIWSVTTLHDPRHSLLTSDRPLVMTNGLGREDGHLVLPIGPNRVFMAANNKRTMQQIHSIIRSGNLSDTLNDRVAVQARKFVYATTDSQLRFVEKRLGARERNSPWE